MNTVNFVTNRNNVYNKVFATSAYTARAREKTGMPPEIIERMTITADDKLVIDPIIENCINEISTYITRYHPNSSVDFITDEHEGHYLFNIVVPDNYPIGNEDKFEKSVENYITNRTMQEWYSIIKPDEANIPAAKAQSDILTIQTLLTQRKKPSSSFE